MPTVNLPSADWSVVLYLIEDAYDRGQLVGSLLKDIEAQLDKQEN